MALSLSGETTFFIDEVVEDDDDDDNNDDDDDDNGVISMREESSLIFKPLELDPEEPRIRPSKSNAFFCLDSY